MRQPFSSGTEYLDWDLNNCRACQKGYRFKDGTPAESDTPPDDLLCPIQTAIFWAMVEPEISDEIATRWGLGPGQTRTPACREFDPEGGGR